MAANLQSSSRLAARRALTLARPDRRRSRPASVWGAFHLSTYDKNPDEQVRPAVTPPNDVVRLGSDGYWAPHPKTGVFGPALDVNGGDRRRSVGSHGFRDEDDDGDRSGGGGGGGSVLDQTIWVRSVEGVDRPPSY